MNHPLAVYTVIYVAILFVTVSIWGGKIGDATGDYRVLLLAQATFGLKLAIDDYIHFQGAKDKVVLDLSLSLLIYLLLATSIAMAASGRGTLATGFFCAVFVAGIAWLLTSGFSGPERPRRQGWLVINALTIAFLLFATFKHPPQSTGYTCSTLWLGAVVMLLVGDFFYFGTLTRLAVLNRIDATDSPASPMRESTNSNQNSAARARHMGDRALADGAETPAHARNEAPKPTPPKP